jgi:hypothetical protein
MCDALLGQTTKIALACNSTLGSIDGWTWWCIFRNFGGFLKIGTSSLLQHCVFKVFLWKEKIPTELPCGERQHNPPLGCFAKTDDGIKVDSFPPLHHDSVCVSSRGCFQISGTFKQNGVNDRSRVLCCRISHAIMLIAWPSARNNFETTVHQ